MKKWRPEGDNLLVSNFTKDSDLDYVIECDLKMNKYHLFEEQSFCGGLPTRKFIGSFADKDLAMAKDIAEKIFEGVK